MVSENSHSTFDLLYFVEMWPALFRVDCVANISGLALFILHSEMTCPNTCQNSFLVKGFSMRKLMIMALAAVAVVAWSNTDLSAQTYQNSYRFGVGLGYGNNFGNFGFNNRLHRGFPLFGGSVGVLPRHEAPPYFAQFPPVYYSGITPRPYGISPYAAPPGITPVEMTVPQPQAVTNPYYQQEVAPVSNQPNVNEVDTDNKTTHIVNPYTGAYSQK